MIKIGDKELSVSTIEMLKNLQSKIDGEDSFAKRADKAQSLWNSKGGTDGKKAFEEVKEMLTSMCVYVEICNYCEQSEANDIEHIAPKSFFPDLAFVWKNYLLACKQCNSGLKLDKCFVIDAAGNSVETIRGEEPLFKQIAFINPRTEDPNDFMYLNMQTFKFDIFPWLSNLNKSKAISTIEILQLNDRATLVKARESAKGHYYDKLDRLVRVLKTKNKTQLKKALNPATDKFDLTKSIPDLKEEVLESYKLYIQKYQHPSVWHSIKKIESQSDELWKEIFKQIPDALNW
jgi:uncharacterized protein (TIGR02646 family)